MKHNVTFDLTPKERLCPDGKVGEQTIVIEGRNIPLEFDGRKLFLRIRVPTDDELINLKSYEVTSPAPFTPESRLSNRRDKKN